MTDSPAGWGDKALNGTGTGLERGGDPPERDAADETAAKLLPCLDDEPNECAALLISRPKSAMICEHCRIRPAVAAALRERDERIAALTKERDEALAAMNADTADVVLAKCVAERERDDYRRGFEAAERRISSLEQQNESQCTLRDARIDVLEAENQRLARVLEALLLCWKEITGADEATTR